MFGILIAFFSTTHYKSELTFVVEDEKAGHSLGAITGVASQFGFDLGGGSSTTFSKQNIMELLKSRGVVKATLLEEGIINGKKDLLVEHYITIKELNCFS